MGFQKGYWTSRWPPSPHTSDRLRWRGRHDQSVSCCPGYGRKKRKIHRGGGERDHQKPASVHALMPVFLKNASTLSSSCLSNSLWELFAARSILEHELLRRGDRYSQRRSMLRQEPQVQPTPYTVVCPSVYSGRKGKALTVKVQHLRTKNLSVRKGISF